MKSSTAPSLQRGWHNVYDLHYHCVFTVKYRRALLDLAAVAELTRISLEIQERHEIKIECLGTDQNHVHLLCAAPPALAPSDMVRIYKSITARELFKALPLLRKELWGGAFWSGGYFITTVGQRGGYEAIKRYVQSQGQTPEEANLRLLFELPDEK
jgi:putative transposase